jgi:hypothetical protein
VETLYIETANYKTPRPRDANFAHRRALATFLDAAHERGLRVVGWYLPALDDHRLDRRRMLAAIRFETPSGERFDSVAVDFESTEISSMSSRDRAGIRFSRDVRRWAGPHAAVGAITPDSLSTTIDHGLWPQFPFHAIRRYYDVFLPMAYSTYRAHGGSDVYAYTRGNITHIRDEAGDPHVPVHIIGGLTRDGVDASEANAVVRAAKEGGALGVSFYGFENSRGHHFRALRRAQ